MGIRNSARDFFSGRKTAPIPSCYVSEAKTSEKHHACSESGIENEKTLQYRADPAILPPGAGQEGDNIVRYNLFTECHFSPVLFSPCLCGNRVELIQQSTRKEGEKYNHDIVVFRQQINKGLTVDVNANWTPVLEKWRARGYEHITIAGLGANEKLECVEVNNVANFDCIGCRKHQFVYDMSVKLVGTQTKKDGARGVILLLQRRLVTKALIC